jgi:hypothetical protein
VTDPYELSVKLAALPLPLGEFPIRSASDLLQAFAAGCDSRGRYYAESALLRRLVYWADIPAERIAWWLEELVDRGDLEVRPDAIDCYSGEPVEVAYLLHPRRFQRFQNRRKIPKADREAVFRRDDYRCRVCGTRKNLTIDHIHPWSRGGLDRESNYQALCQPCNSRKGARV